MPLSRLEGPRPIFAAVALLLLAGSCNAFTYTYTCNSKKFTYDIQSPYKVPVQDRVSPVNPSASCAAITTFVYTDDAPFDKSYTIGKPGSDPRAELRLLDTYTSGTHELSLEINIASGVVDTTVAQILDAPLSGSGGQDPSLQLRVGKDEISVWGPKPGGGITSKGKVTGVYGKWVPIRIVHSATSKPGTITVYANNKKIASFGDFGTKTKHYFKFGVYSQIRTTSAASRKKRQASFKAIVYK